MIAVLLRRLGMMKQVKIGRVDAVQLAEAEAIRQGWPWRGDIEAKEGFRDWTVRSNARVLGKYVEVKVSCEDGSIISAVSLGGPR